MKLYDKFLNKHATQYDLSEDQNKNINILSRPKNLTLNFSEDNLSPVQPLEVDEEVKIAPKNYCWLELN